MTVAFFDMDRTLITVNSARLWVEHMWRQGELTKRELLRSVAGIVGYKLAVVDMDALARDAVARLTGSEETEIRDRVRAWYPSTIRPTICPMMRDVVENHREDGHQVVLLTASSPYVAEPLAEELGIEEIISSRFEVHEGRFTGKLVEPLCYGRGKVALSELWASKRGIDLTESWFYTDSYTDLPMIRRVGNPRVVNPDPRLARWAKRNGIPTLLTSATS